MHCIVCMTIFAHHHFSLTTLNLPTGMMPVVTWEYIQELQSCSFTVTYS